MSVFLPDSSGTIAYEGFLETIDILADPEMMMQLKGSAKDVKAGRLFDLYEAL